MMRLVDRPTLFPKACVCGNAVNGPFLDTGMQNLFDAKQGRVYLCAVHFLEALKVEKLVPFAEHEQQVARLGEALGQIVRLEEQARLGAAAAGELKRQLDDSADTVAGLRVQIELLERRVAEAQADPARAEHERAIAKLTKPPARPRQSRAGRAS